MSELHRAYLSLGSNIQPDVNLVKAVQLLQKHGWVQKISNAWESRSVGAEGPNYLNACVLFVTSLAQSELKDQVLLPIERELGRIRTEDRFAPRPMDLDIVVFDGKSCEDKYWEQAFIVIPLAEIEPNLQNPVRRESVAATATRLHTGFWMEARREILSQFNANSSKA